MEDRIADQSIIDRFMDKVLVSEEDECWLWNGGYNNKNRGYFYCEGRTQIAARIAHRIHNGPIPDNELVMHSCDNTMCVNPNHLSTGTHADNVDDMISKGRNVVNVVFGSNHGSARLNEEQISEIRSLLKEGWTQRALGNKYGVSESTISDIALRKSWSHVS